MSTSYSQRLLDSLFSETECLLGYRCAVALFEHLYKYAPAEIDLLQRSIHLPLLSRKNAKKARKNDVEATEAINRLVDAFDKLASSFIGTGMAAKLVYFAVVKAGEGHPRDSHASMLESRFR